ncbi:MAG: DsbA family protein [Candidatus Methanoperedens sp.]|nr:DsbA family protein [Candidatus Methanoperedens sp.]
MAKKKQKIPEKKASMTWVYVGLAVLVIVGLAVYYSSSTSNTNTNTSSSNDLKGKVPTAGIFGTMNKPTTYEAGKVKLIEFIRFNCGHCNTFNSQLPALKKKYGDKLEITYKPMLWMTIKGDPALTKTNQAYILAERMGKGEEMKDAIFKALWVENRDITSEIQLEDIGKSVGLGDEFITALKNGDAKDEADADINLSLSFQVDETPTIIINGNFKVVPSMTNEDTAQMTNNLDTIINSLLS